MAADALYLLSRELLDAAGEALALSPGGAIPEAAWFVAPGNPTFDCAPLLAVHAGGPRIADTLPLQPPLAPGQRPQRPGHVNLVTLTITVLRCVTTLESVKQLPPRASLETDGAKIQGDVWTIWNHLLTLKRFGMLFPPADRWAFFEGAVPVRLMGGVGGWQIPLEVQLDGYRTVEQP